MGQWLRWSGLVAGLFYLGGVWIGDWLRDDYNGIFNSISELSVRQAANKGWMDLIFGVYNFGLLLFAYKLVQYSKQRGKLISVGAWMLLGIAVCGGAMLFFPQDPRGAALTGSGLIHLVLAGIISPLTVAAVFLLGWSFQGRVRYVNLLFCTFILVSGVLTACSTESDYFGLFERVTIFSFIVWLVGYSTWFARLHNNTQ